MTEASEQSMRIPADGVEIEGALAVRKGASGIAHLETNAFGLLPRSQPR